MNELLCLKCLLSHHHHKHRRRRHSIQWHCCESYAHFYRTLTHKSFVCVHKNWVLCFVPFFFSRCSLVTLKVCHLFNRFSMKVSGSNETKSVCFVYFFLVCACAQFQIQYTLCCRSSAPMNMIPVFEFSVSFLWIHQIKKRTTKRTSASMIYFSITLVCVCMHGFKFLLTGQLKLAANIDFLSVVLLSS